MKRIGTSDGRFVDGTRRVPGTPVTAQWLNNLQEELAGIVEEAGIELDESDEKQVLKALEKIIQSRSSGIVESIDALREKAGEAGQVVTVRGYYADTPGVGGGVFYAAAGQSDEDNGGTVIKGAAGATWYKFDAEITPEDFGARGDGVTDDTAAFEALEKVITHDDVGLGGRTYLVARNFVGNRYDNGLLIKSDKANYNKSKPLFRDHIYRQNAGNSQKLFSLGFPVGDGVLPSVFQSAVFDNNTNALYVTMGQTKTGSGHNTEKSVLIKYIVGGANDLTPVWVSAETDVLGHQNLGIERQNGVLKFWCTGGIRTNPFRGRTFSRFEFDEEAKEFKNIQDFVFFGQEFNADGSLCIGVCPSYQTVVVNGVRTADDAWVCRVFDISKLPAEGGDCSDLYDYEFVFDRFGAVQSMCTDGRFVYILQGGNYSTPANMFVYTIAGDYVMRDANFRLGRVDAANIVDAGGTAYYEPEALFLMPAGAGLELCCLTAIGKSAGGETYNHVVNSVRMPILPRLRDTSGSAPLITLDGARDIGFVGDLAFGRVDGGEWDELARIGTASFRLFRTNSTAYIEVSGNPQAQLRLTNNVRTGMLQMSTSGNLGIYDNTSSKWVILSNTDGQSVFGMDLVPASDNAQNLGAAATRIANSYFGTSPTVTSDERQKQDIDTIPDNVIEAWREVGFCQYRWREAVAEKGVGARYHTGLIAQRVRDAFAARGLDAQDYGLLCYDQWPEQAAQDAVLDDDGNVVEPAIEYRAAGERWGIRADECLFLEAESQRRMITELEARLEKLEGLMQ